MFAAKRCLRLPGKRFSTALLNFEDYLDHHVTGNYNSRDFEKGLLFGRRSLATNPAFSQGRTLYLIDLRSHGSSFHAPLSLTSMADDLVRLMDHEQIDKSVLLGHSLGGKVSMSLALHNPDRVEKLAVVDIAPVTYPLSDSKQMGSVAAVHKAMQDLDLSAVTSRRQADEMLKATIPDVGTRGFVLQNLVPVAGAEQGTGGNHRWRIPLQLIGDGMARIADFTAPLDAQFWGPTVFMAGAHSSYVRREYSEAIHALFPRAQLLSFADAGHMVHVEQPARLSAVFAAFLQHGDVAPAHLPPGVSPL